MVDFFCFYVNHGLKSVATIDAIPLGFYMGYYLFNENQTLKDGQKYFAPTHLILIDN